MLLVFEIFENILVSEKQIAYWQKMKESKSSLYSKQGRANEDFFGYVMQKMWDNRDLKAENMDWLFHITRDGKKKFNCVVRKRTSKNLDQRPFSDPFLPFIQRFLILERHNIATLFSIVINNAFSEKIYPVQHS